MIRGDGTIEGRSYYYGNADLDPRATNHIVVDGINRQGIPIHDVNPMNNLMMAMIQHLTKSSATGGGGLPCIVRRSLDPTSIVRQRPQAPQHDDMSLTSFRLPWQQLKTGFSERTALSQQNLADSPSSLAFAIACYKSSGSHGHMIFIDLRNREEERSMVNTTHDEHKKVAKDKRQVAQAEKSSNAALEKLEKGKTKRVLAKCFQAIKGLSDIYYQSPTKAMEQSRTRILREKENTERKAVERSQKRAREETRRRDKEINYNDSARRIKAVQELWLEQCNEIAKLGTGNARACDVFDVCAVSFFRNVRAAGLPNLSLSLILHIQSPRPILHLPYPSDCTFCNCAETASKSFG